MSAVNYLHNLNRPANYNSIINNEKFIIHLLSNIKKKLGRQLIKTEKQLIVSYLQNIDPVVFVGKSTEYTLNVMTNNLVDRINKFICGQDRINIHEMLKNEIIGLDNSEFTLSGGNSRTNDIVDQVVGSTTKPIGISAILGMNDVPSLVTQVLNSQPKVQSMYLLLDTRYRILDNDGSKFYKWNFINNRTLQQGGVNAITSIQNITAMRVFPTKVPYVNLLDNNPFQRVSMYIGEFSAQSIVAQENRNYHFMFKSNTNNRFVDLEVGENPYNGYYKFNQPIARLDTITITFGSPLQEVVFDTDRLVMSITSYSTITTFLATQNHNLETGDLVYISNFTTVNPIYDATIISSINDVNGLTATYVNNTTITIPIDTLTLNFTGPGSVDVVNGSTSITGTSTTFTTTFNPNDNIQILGVRYRVVSITSNTLMTIGTIPTPTGVDPGYAGTTANTLLYSKNNTIDGIMPNIYFGSKRAFIPIELEYLEPANIN